ncbi:MAG: RNA polymerase factor sigma-54 [Planctomycetota bacterium]
MAKLGLHQGLAQRQELALAPRMLQAIEVLALPSTDLEGWLLEQAERNEALLVEAAERLPERALDPASSGSGRARASDDHRALLEAQPSRPPSLVDLVEDQIAARDLEPELLEWIRFLVGCLDGGGLLVSSDDELLEAATRLDLPGAGARAGQLLLGRAVAELQQLEPTGIGARSPVEALLLQLDPSDPDYALLCRLLEDFLVELARNRRPAVAAKLGLDLSELERLLAVLGHLETRPAGHLSGAAAPVVVPDVVVLENEGELVVEVARGRLPTIRIDPDAEKLLASRAIDREARAYLRKKVERARWVREAVEMRGATLLRVAEAAVRGQRRYFAEGPTALVPLSMTEVAAQLELAISTVSRCVAGKSLQSSWGIVPLRTLFQTPASDAQPGATEAVRERVRRLVEAEDPAAPLSDEAIVQALEEAGQRVARRTVAKYRSELGIPSSYRRRRHS